MADASVIHIGENSPEEVALKLLRMVLLAEKKTLNGEPNVDRKYILDTYAECLNTVKYPEAKT